MLLQIAVQAQQNAAAAIQPADGLVVEEYVVQEDADQGFDILLIDNTTTPELPVMDNVVGDVGAPEKDIDIDRVTEHVENVYDADSSLRVNLAHAFDAAILDIDVPVRNEEGGEAEPSSPPHEQVKSTSDMKCPGAPKFEKRRKPDDDDDNYGSSVRRKLNLNAPV